MFKKIITMLFGIGFIFIVSEANAEVKTLCGSISIDINDYSYIFLDEYQPVEAIEFGTYLPISLHLYYFQFQSIGIKNGDTVCVKGDWELKEIYVKADCEDCEGGWILVGIDRIYRLKSAPTSIRVMELYSISSE